MELEVRLFKLRKKIVENKKEKEKKI